MFALLVLAQTDLALPGCFVTCMDECGLHEKRSGFKTPALKKTY